MQQSGALEAASVGGDVWLFELAGEILERPERLLVFGVGQRVEDVKFDVARSIEGVRGRLLIGHGESTLLRVRASARGSIPRRGRSLRVAADATVVRPEPSSCDRRPRRRLCEPVPGVDGHASLHLSVPVTACALGRSAGWLLAMRGDAFDLLPPERARAIRLWLATPLAACGLCGRPVYRTDPRQRDPDEPDEEVVALVHLPCLRASRGERDR